MPPSRVTWESDRPEDARRDERVPTRLPVRFGIGVSDRSAHASNVSETGLYIHTNRVYKVGTVLSLAIEFPERTTHHRGEVMWAIQVPEHLRDTLAHGMGVNLIDSDPDWPDFYRRWKQQISEAARR